MIEWETGEITAEPLSIIAVDDPVTCAIYAKQHNRLESNGWKRFEGIQKIKEAIPYGKPSQTTIITIGH